MTQRNLRRLLAALPVVFLVPACASIPSPPSAGVDAAPPHRGLGADARRAYQERYRPQYHFSPAVNWMNDPNGLVYYAGDYHLFYQYNPFGDKWGHMSWGHAVSPDLVHWQHLPVAIPEADGVMAFSGSAVVDWKNTSGFGRAGEPPLVAVYTGAREKNQSQYLAYSTDRGRTWTRYAGNPVLDIGSGDFRDPKVFWYEPQKKWVMAVVLATEHKVRFYSSPDLKQWTRLSDFGPAAAVGGVWEVPDLFELPVDGDRRKMRWVLKVDLNPGGPAGGSGGQYFIGHFDGTNFTTVEPPAGKVFADFEDAGYGSWVATGDAFGQRPARGAFPGQSPVDAFRGTGLVNTFLGGDAAQGTLTSPEFTISANHINFLIGGGNHPGQVGMSLLVGGQEVRTTTGRDTETLKWHSWDVRDLRGRTARIEIFDRHSGGWGHINVDHLMFASRAVTPAVERTLWVDYGADFYAPITFSDLPPEQRRRVWLGWMNNWLYGQDVPTSPWRSAQSIPRRLSLRTIGGEIRLVQQPVAELKQLRGSRRRLGAQAIAEGTTPLTARGISGKALEIIAEFEPGTASEFGLKVRTGNAEETVIGVLPKQNVVFVDRSRAGNTDFHPAFAARHEGPVRLQNGRVRLHVFVDWSSVEVFAGDGQTVITDQIFPAPESEGVALYAQGGTSRLVSLNAWPLRSVWTAPSGQGGAGSR